MLELNSRVLPVKFNDKQYQLTYPTVDDILDYTEKLEVKGTKEVTVIKELLEKLGMPKNISGSMEIGHLKLIVEELVKPKK